MPQIPDSLKLLFEASLKQSNEGYTITIPQEFVENGSLNMDETYRIAFIKQEEAESSKKASQPNKTEPATDVHPTPTGKSEIQRNQSPPTTQSHSPTPPVQEGETRTVSIDSLGDEGDGIAKVDNGYILIVSDTQPGDRVEVEITDVKQNVAFAEPISEPTVR